MTQADLLKLFPPPGGHRGHCGIQKSQSGNCGFWVRLVNAFPVRTRQLCRSKRLQSGTFERRQTSGAGSKLGGQSFFFGTDGGNKSPKKQVWLSSGNQAADGVTGGASSQVRYLPSLRSHWSQEPSTRVLVPAVGLGAKCPPQSDFY